MIDSQMDDMIKEKLALKQQIDSLEQNLSNIIKEKESLLHTFTVFKSKSKEKEYKYIDKEIDLEKKIKELDILFTNHVFDDEETLILEEVSRSKILAKQNNPISKEKKINTTPINYDELNRLSEDFSKRFVSQKELSDEQAFWLQTSHPNTDQFASSLVKIEAPRELPKRVAKQRVAKRRVAKQRVGKQRVAKQRVANGELLNGELLNDELLNGELL
ncbi:hypothetical protein Tco_0758828, partial [Tanacetum coccineum]